VPDASEANARSLVAAQAIVAAVGAGLLAYTATRALRLSFTHDESLSFLFHVSRPFWSVLLDADTANNHLLNTLLMQASGGLFGSHPFALRLPNLVAHVAYLVFSFLWLRGFGRPAVLVAGFLLLNGNPYLLDFFSLARGYGLAMGALMASVYFMTRALDSRDARLEAASLAAAALAVVASYTLLNVYLALLAAFALAAVGRGLASEPRKPLVRFLLQRSLPAAIISSLLAAVLVTPLRQLRGGDQLYYGGTEGFWSDTVLSLIDRTVYAGAPAPESVRVLGALAIVLTLAGVVVVIATRLRRDGPETLASPVVASCVLLVVSALATVVQHHLLAVRYLEGRTALFLVPLFVATAICLWTALHGARARLGAVVTAAALALASALHLASSLNTSTTLDWRYDAHTVDVVRQLEEQRAAAPRRTRVGINWRFGPTILFYRNTRLDWLFPVENADTHHAELDRTGFGARLPYYYVLDEDLGSIAHDVELVRSFASTEVGTPALYRAVARVR
jgi:hypothetical protein